MMRQKLTDESYFLDRELLPGSNGNATRHDYSTEVWVPQLVAQQAAATPEAVAIVGEDCILCYRELNQRANQLARYLQSLGVGPNVPVALCVSRSPDMVVGLLGILKAGGAYVPLDPAYPRERLAFMLEDTQAPVLVTQRKLAASLPTQHTRVVCLDADSEIVGQQGTADLSLLLSPHDLAYVIYTSGSTGRPKGVQITHENLLNLVFWHQRAFEITPLDRATQLTSPAFDATGWELWPYLTIGASVYLMDEQSRSGPGLCRDWLLRHDITITFLPTLLAEGVMGLEWPSRTSLRTLLTGADTLHRYPAPSLPFAVVNNYGPTEATVVASSGRVLPRSDAGEPPPIGRPIDNARIYILDEHLQQVPVGEPGELYIGGAGVAKGYLNRPDLTDERFIPDPFGNEPGARLYKTGDLARYLPDGQLAFLGRADHQIKIRGYRIEPGEIVSILNEHPAIQTSLVIAREDTPGDKHLVAYLVPLPGARVTLRLLRERLEMHLPDYMIPSAFVQLEALPLTPNGKLDRAALPPPDSTNMVRDEIIAAPRTLTEEQLERIVAPLLGLEQVGVEDNFFLLGGHSLLGAQLIMQISQVFGIDLTLRTLFESPSIRQLAAQIESTLLAKIEKMSDQEVYRLLEHG